MTLLHCEPLEQRRLLAVLTVNSELDNLIPDDGLVTLREAIIAANSNTTTDLGQTATGGDQIVFDPSIDGKTINLSIPGTGEDAAQTGDLDITHGWGLTITGNGASQTIVDANSIDRAFDIKRSSSGVTFENMTITGGVADGSGGAIRSLNLDELTILGSTISGNSAGERGGGIFVTGYGFTVANSTISSNSADIGGGIFAAQDVTVENTTISENFASTDGGISAIGNVTVSNSSIWKNSSRAQVRSFGAGAISASGDVIVGNSTISENNGGAYGGPGGIKANGNVTVTNSTIWRNNGGHGDIGGIITAGQLALTGSIVAGNGARSVYYFWPGEFSAAIVAVTNSLIGDNSHTGLTFTQIPDLNGNLIGSPASPIDPLLGPLQDNGGPTLTHALLPGSPAINAGSNPARFRFDQRGRGFSRRVGSAPDMGAVEVQETFLVVNSELDNIVPGDGLVTLREAIIAANSDTTTDLGETGSGADWIVFDRSLDGKTVALSIAGTDEDAAQTGDLDITDPAGLTITGSVVSQTIVDARSVDRVFDILGNSGPVRFENLIITGGATTSSGKAPNGGGAIRSLSGAALTIIGSTISDNAAHFGGGGVFAAGDVTVESATISANSASSGGGIHAHGNVTVSGSKISGNATSHHGGGISARRVDVTSSTIVGNSAGHSGGAGIFSAGDVTVESTTISENLASRGSGIVAVGNVTVTNSTISLNSTGEYGDGGGIYADGNVIVESSTISGNSSQWFRGGGILSMADVTVTNSTVTGNSTAAEGGGIWAFNVTLVSSIVAGNTAESGPDFNAATVNATNSLIGDNRGTGLTITHNPNLNGNLIGSPASPFDPFLGPLQDNGGPTFTHALVYGSPAIDAGGNPLGMGSDQRGAGFRRVVGAAPDMGAWELQGVFLTVNSELDNLIPGDGLVTLREAIIAANNDTATDLGETADGADQIVFDPSLDGKTVALSIAGTDEDAAQTGDLDITDPAGLTITGNGARQTIVDGQSIDRIFDVQGASGPVTIENLTIAGGSTTGGNTSGGGGGIRSMFPVELTITGSTISGNSTYGFNVGGGGIFARGGLTIENSSIEGNSAYSHGGGIHAFGNLTVSHTTISGNSARFGDGGGIDAIGDFGESISLRNSTISGNSGNYGGGLFISGDAAIEYSTISGNSAKSDGGAIFLSTGNLIISSSIVARNMAAGQSPSVPLPRPSKAHDVFTGSEEGDSVTALYSLIGDNTGTRLAEAQTPDANGNLIGTSAAPIDSLLGPLRDNGGPTLTHALMPGSPAINAGKNEPPIDVRGTPVYFDQRGESFSRLVGDRADMGAFEVQASGEHLLGDVDLDGTVSFADFLILSGNFGNNDVARENGDLNGDGAVSFADFLILSANFGKKRAIAEPVSWSESALGALATDKFFSQVGGEVMMSERLAGVRVLEV